MFKRIFVPTDGSARSLRAVKAATGIARKHGGVVTFFHATAPYHPPYAMEDYAMDWMPEPEFRKRAYAAAMKLLGKAQDIASAGKVKAKTAHAFSDTPARAILDAARKARADTIVMASHGRTGIDRIFLGSETQKVLAQSKVPVLVVR